MAWVDDIWIETRRIGRSEWWRALEEDHQRLGDSWEKLQRQKIAGLFRKSKEANVEEEARRWTWDQTGMGALEKKSNRNFGFYSEQFGRWHKILSSGVRLSDLDIIDNRLALVPYWEWAGGSGRVRMKTGNTIPISAECLKG